MESDLGIFGVWIFSQLCQWKLGIYFLESGESVICDIENIPIGATSAYSSGWCRKSKKVKRFVHGTSCGALHGTAALQLKAQKIMFLSLCPKLVAALFLYQACFLEKEMVDNFQSLLMMYKGNVSWGIKQMLGQGRCFPLLGFHFPLGSGQVVTESWHLGGHSWLGLPDPQHHQKYFCWTLWMVQLDLDLKLSSPSLPWIFANSPWDQAGLWTQQWCL